MCDHFHLRWVRDRTVFGDSVPQEIKGGEPKLALGGVDNKSMLAEPLEKRLEVHKVLGFGRTRYQDVVQEHKKKRHVTYHRVHETLKKTGLS
ncbi:hypothetical protein JOB18_017883 [Solea senegalensis]|uniref:Uncharacterized protein n=1 Tax=Solea senegalensis TaxID=28829 RepID=A0AAV6T6C5_SOLSE|nr:hypothetical protein JOB18_017883 [Solea senegalensis]